MSNWEYEKRQDQYRYIEYVYKMWIDIKIKDFMEFIENISLNRGQAK